MKKTPFERAGYKPDDVFVVMESDDSGYHTEGDLAVLENDDGSDCPLFNNGNDEMYDGKAFVYVHHLRKIGTL